MSKTAKKCLKCLKALPTNRTKRYCAECHSETKKSDITKQKINKDAMIIEKPSKRTIKKNLVIDEDTEKTDRRTLKKKVLVDEDAENMPIEKKPIKRLIKKKSVEDVNNIMTDQDSEEEIEKKPTDRLIKKKYVEDVDNIMTDQDSEEEIEKKQPSKKYEAVCQATTKDGTCCASKASKQYGNKYCGRHKYVYVNQAAIDSGKMLCKSTRKCAGQQPGVKAPLPKGYNGTLCQSCSIIINKRDCERRSERKMTNGFTDNKGIIICVRCGKHCRLGDMGRMKNGNRSEKCKGCFEGQQEVERRRAKRNR